MDRTWHPKDVRSDVVLLGNSLLVVCIDFRKGDGILAGVFGRKAFVYGSYLLAWPAPVCVNFSKSVKVLIPDRVFVMYSLRLHRWKRTAET